MDLYTHPGKLGDLLWALATMAANARGEAFDIATSPYCQPLVPLLQQQSYIARAYCLDSWQVRWDAPPSPAVPPWTAGVYSRVFHMGMREWPSPDLPRYYPQLMRQEYGLDIPVSFDTPWLYLGNAKRDEIVLSFSDEWVELKAGWILAMLKAFPMSHFHLVCREGSRLFLEFPFPFRNLKTSVCGILGLADVMAAARLVITCNSLGHPLATALGTPAVIAEPSVPRQQSVFKSPCTRNTYFDGVNAYELVDIVREKL